MVQPSSPRSIKSQRKLLLKGRWIPKLHLSVHPDLLLILTIVCTFNKTGNKLIDSWLLVVLKKEQSNSELPILNSITRIKNLILKLRWWILRPRPKSQEVDRGQVIKTWKGSMSHAITVQWHLVEEVTTLNGGITNTTRPKLLRLGSRGRGSRGKWGS